MDHRALKVIFLQVFFGILLFAWAGFSYAQTPSSCPPFLHSMFVGSTDASTDGEVSRLQTFLQARDPLYTGGVVGIYGPLTRAAVGRFQKENGIAGITDLGYGIVGPRTRKKLNSLCTAAFDISSTERVSMLSPNGGEIFHRRATSTITWQADAPAMVRLFLIDTAEKRTWVINDVPSRAGVNSYSWFVGGGNIDTGEPQAQHPLINTINAPGGGTHYKIQACVLSSQLCDESNMDFEIRNPSILQLTVYVQDIADPTDVIHDNVAVLLHGKDIAYNETASDDDGKVKFYNVPYGTYILAAGAEGYAPAKQDPLFINNQTTRYDPDKGGRVRDAGISLVSLSSIPPPPPVKVKNPQGGEVWHMPSSQPIVWQSGAHKFSIFLLSLDRSQMWLLGTTTDSYFVWNVGSCLLPCNPIVPGDYYVRVEGGGGRYDDTNRPITLVSP